MTNELLYDIIYLQKKERRNMNMTTTINGITYDLLIVNIARSFGLESKQVFEFIEYINSNKTNDEIQNKYNEIMGVNEKEA